MTSESGPDNGANSGPTNGDPASSSGEMSHDSLGDTQLGRSLKELIKEIGKEKEALTAQAAAGQGAGAADQDADDFDPSQTRFDKALELAAAATATAPPEQPSPEAEAAPATATEPTPPPLSESAGDAGTAGSDPDSEISQAVAGMESILRRFAEAERRRSEEQIAEWKVQLKKATMIVIKKQVDTARAKWMKNLSANEARVAEHYRRLKALADKVAKQKAQIQAAKLELEQKLEVADRLHTEFDEIRQVLGGQIGAIDALEDSEESDET